MAHPAVGGDEYPPVLSYGGGHPFQVHKRRIPDSEDRHNTVVYKRPRFGDQVAFRPAEEPHGFPHPHPHHHPQPQPQPHYHPYQHPHHPRTHTHTPEPAACAMERTASGLSIKSEPTELNNWTELLTDEKAAQRVRDHMTTFRRRNPDSKHERILRSIINPRGNPTKAEQYKLDNESLESIFSAANEIFFNGRLSQRVMWDWSHTSSAQYDSDVIGTTALRPAPRNTKGFETLIVLSSPILQDERYSRRLLISTFLHELIHSYLFICCGFRARECGGHPPGFHTIAKLIDDWAGAESALYLSKIEADLERFRLRRGSDWRSDEEDEEDGRMADDVYPCLGITEHIGPDSQDRCFRSQSPDGNYFKNEVMEDEYFKNQPTENNFFKMRTTEDNPFRRHTVDDSHFKDEPLEDNYFKNQATEDEYFRNHPVDDCFSRNGSAEDSYFDSSGTTEWRHRAIARPFYPGGGGRRNDDDNDHFNSSPYVYVRSISRP
ncbi:hypothetical protein B0T22DRAFT_42615 [Podospora appendiculata]|uniref:SprT-like domain-containing protein n=1 Tax=Podospora appendiculata TaxID=314037 RepID=A0AAE0XHG5_9PEZI|nr:hypothetical protein B0T22DRAFT_42615 [Podospora appendiculata]